MGNQRVEWTRGVPEKVRGVSTKVEQINHGQPNECVMFDSKETIDELRDCGQLPKGLYEAELGKIYLFTENGEFKLLP